MYLLSRWTEIVFKRNPAKWRNVPMCVSLPISEKYIPEGPEHNLSLILIPDRMLFIYGTHNMFPDGSGGRMNKYGLQKEAV